MDGFSYVAEPSECHYLPDQMWQLEYRMVRSLSREQYLTLLKNGWRRFGSVLFRPQCASCNACQSLRIVVEKFAPDRSQRRVAKANEQTTLTIGEPKLDIERIQLYYRHHAHHAETKGWPFPDVDGAVQHISTIMNGPIPVQEWSYRIDGKLVAVSYIDRLSEGYSGIYFYLDPDYRQYSLGNWICLSLIQEARRNGLPYVYLGYYIQGCRSMEYKGRFSPSEILNPDGTWSAF